MANFFNNYFQSITRNLNLLGYPGEPKFNIFDEIDIIIYKSQSHPSIIELKQKFSIKRKFAFKLVTEEFVQNIANDLSSNKAVGWDIPPNLLKESTFILQCLVRCINKAI